MQAVVMGCVC